VRFRRPKVDEESLRRVLAKRLHLRGDVRIDYGPEVPGLLVFSAYEMGGRARVTGTFDGKVHTDFEDNVLRVLGALGYGRDHDVAPEVVAGAIGMLEADPGTPFLTAFALEQNGDDRMALPTSTTWEGHPAVSFWNGSSRMAPWRSLVVALPDGTYLVRRDTPE
jgi:hypothetical protein